MAESTEFKKSPLLFGRTKILTDEAVITEKNVAQVLKDALVTHRQNSNQIDYLYRYYKGEQPILKRTKEKRPEICNKIVENRAYEIVSFKTGYLCGEPLQYVSRSSKDEVSEEISKLNDMMLLCGKAARDKELAEWMYICGTGYRIITPNSDYIKRSIVPRLLQRKASFSEDEAPFEVYTLDPRNTFVVYHSGLGEKPLMGVKSVVRKDDKVIYSVYTDTQYFELVSEKQTNDIKLVSSQPRKMYGIPIIEYPLNNGRIGSFEVVQSILDAINLTQSNRVDGIEQFIQHLVVITNGEIPEDKAKFLHEYGLITLKSYGQEKADLKIIAEELNQMQTQTLIDYMNQTVLDICGIPNRNGGSSTSDTGSAVIMRDGWSAAEARAKDDETMYKESERQFLKVVLRIMRDTVGTVLTLSDIETKFTRRNYENIQTKAQVLDVMLKNPKINPLLAFTHCGLFSDPEDAARMSSEYYEKVKQEETLRDPPKVDDAVA